tara:strand:+ start:4692 stop:4928 length:237 start_codon:yes stop_codon:yes gene_type:complete
MIDIASDANMGNRRTRIEFYRKDGFGNRRYYIRTGLKAQLIKELLNTETVTKRNMDVMSALFPVDFIEILTPDEETPL